MMDPTWLDAEVTSTLDDGTTEKLKLLDIYREEDGMLTVEAADARGGLVRFLGCWLKSYTPGEWEDEAPAPAPALMTVNGYKWTMTIDGFESAGFVPVDAAKVVSFTTPENFYQWAFDVAVK